MEVQAGAVATGREHPSPPRPYTPPQRLWPATPRGVNEARHALAEKLTEWSLPELADSASLVLAELMTNAQKHGWVDGRSIGVSVSRIDTGVLIEVHDARGEHLPRLVAASLTDVGGRGLAIVDAVTGQRWGVMEREGPGKVVWAVCSAA
ncbi:ATP-binding protein [Streptomyces polygonati]|uniref:ATP-binding protein n=1 Tax=Streptomyces polygonati TaxID=1617087 RepID=A0ABV8HWB0_9ACTN